MKGRHLNIAITCPNYLPYVRRGAERYSHDLCKFLSSRGHDVTIITSKPGKARIRRSGNTTIIYHGYLQHPLLLKMPRSRLYLFSLSCLASLSVGSYDIVHNLWHSDGFASSLNRFIKGTNYVFQVITPPISILRSHFLDRLMLGSALKRAERRISPTEYVRLCLKDDWGFESEVIPVPVNCSFFRPSSARDASHPRILFVGDLNDPRKGVELLIEAFNILIEKLPDAVLQLSGQVSPEVKGRLVSRVRPDAIGSVQILGTGKLTDLPKLYSEASVTVLPSRYEAQGMVLTESLACGTPVVGANAGAIPEVVNNPQVGTLFEFNHSSMERSANALYDAILRTIEIAKDPRSVRQCREHAKMYSWEVLGPKIEELYFTAVDGQQLGGSP